MCLNRFHWKCTALELAAGKKERPVFMLEDRPFPFAAVDIGFLSRKKSLTASGNNTARR